MPDELNPLVSNLFVKKRRRRHTNNRELDHVGAVFSGMGQIVQQHTCRFGRGKFMTVVDKHAHPSTRVTDERKDP